MQLPQTLKNICAWIGCNHQRRLDVRKISLVDAEGSTRNEIYKQSPAIGKILVIVFVLIG